MIYVSLTRGDNEKICWLFMTSVAASLSPISLSLSLVFLRFFLRRTLVPRCYRFRCTRTTSRLPINFSLATHPTKLTVSVPFDRDRGPSLSYNFLLASKGIDIKFRRFFLFRDIRGKKICGRRRCSPPPWSAISREISRSEIDRKVIDRSIDGSEKDGFEAKERADGGKLFSRGAIISQRTFKSYLDLVALLERCSPRLYLPLYFPQTAFTPEAAVTSRRAGHRVDEKLDS